LLRPQSLADGQGELSAAKENDLHLIRVGDERYEIPDAIPFGGSRQRRPDAAPRGRQDPKVSTTINPHSRTSIMDLISLGIFLLIGAVAGWLAGLLMRGGGFGLLGNILVGIVGAVIGGFLFGLAGISLGGGMIGSLITAVIGAAVLLLIVGLIKKA
jgi:uncharacterized membrane protein YeaQ/YmgE (transglycosylase-associated protein family)